MQHLIEIWGEMCPIPVIKSQRQMKIIPTGDSLVLETEHSCTARGLVVWAKKAGYSVLEQEVSNGIWHLEITKTH